MATGLYRLQPQKAGAVSLWIADGMVANKKVDSGVNQSGIEIDSY